MSTTPIALEAQKRDQQGTRSSRRLRRDDRLPAVVYGHGQENMNVTLPLKKTLDNLQRGVHLFNLNLDGATESVLVKDVQYNYLGDDILHVDLFRVNLDEEIHSQVQIHLVGDAKGVIAGGILTQMRDTIEVVCRVRDLPDEIRLSVANMEIGDVLHANDIKLPEGVKLSAHDADFTIAMLAAAKIRGDDEIEPETGAQPEIIGEKKTAEQPGVGAKSPNA